MTSPVEEGDLPPSADKRFIEEVVRRAYQAGIDIPAICRAEHIQNPASYPGERVPLPVLSHMYDAISRHVCDPDFLYRVIAQADGINHAIFNVLYCCNDVGAALRLLCRYSAVVTEVCRLTLIDNGANFKMMVQPASGVYVSTIQIEAVLHILARLVHLLTGNPNLNQLHFFLQHSPRFERPLYERYLGHRLAFDCDENAILISRQLHDTPITGSDAALQQYYTHILQRYESTLLVQGDLSLRVQRLFIQRMAFGEPDQLEIACCLNMSKRTLQRQLLELGTTFRALTEAARLAVAREELSNSTLTVNEIAFILGYSDRRAFHRAFKRWTAMTPAASRQQARLQAC